MADPHSQYKETQILTASPGKLLIMLYDGAISSMESACDLMSDKAQYDKVNSLLIKSQEIIGELLGSLDFEVGGDIAKTLQSLYAYMIKKLMEANFQKKAEPIKEVLTFMKDLRSSWADVLQKTNIPNLNSSNNNTSNLNISG